MTAEEIHQAAEALAVMIIRYLQKGGKAEVSKSGNTGMLKESKVRKRDYGITRSLPATRTVA